MSKVGFSLVNARLVTPKGIVKGGVRVSRNGKILDVFSGVKMVSGRVVDAHGKYVLPGLVEVHGHMREPGMEHKETVPTGTRAAIAGGFTTIIDMPNTKPPTTTVTRLMRKIEKIYPGRSYCDYSFFLGVAASSLKELEKVDVGMIAGVKVFMAGHETTPTTVPDDKTLAKICRVLVRRKIRLAVHAEDQWLINHYNNKYEKTGRRDAALWSEIRPMSVVVTAAARAISLAEVFGTKLYLLHLSTPEEFALVNAAKRRGVDVFGELVSYQLAFNTSDYKRLGNKIKVSPAVRSSGVQEEMWQLVRAGKIDVLCSEHTPHEWETKSQDDVWLAQSGTPNIQETLPLLITSWVRKFGRRKLEEGLLTVAKLASRNPARIFGFGSKGEIKKGKDADLVVVDVDSVWKVAKKDLFTKVGWSAYEGMKLVGRPVKTFLRGEMVYDYGRVVGEPVGNCLH